MDVEVAPEAREELKSLPPDEVRAMFNAFEKLQAIGAQLPYPTAARFRERSFGSFGRGRDDPRGGRSTSESDTVSWSPPSRRKRYTTHVASIEP